MYSLAVNPSRRKGPESEVLEILNSPSTGYLNRMNLTHHRINVQKDMITHEWNPAALSIDNCLSIHTYILTCSWDAFAPFAGNTLPSRADSDNAEDATILWCHVPYSETSRRSQEHETSVSRPALPCPMFVRVSCQPASGEAGKRESSNFVDASENVERGPFVSKQRE